MADTEFKRYIKHIEKHLRAKLGEHYECDQEQDKGIPLITEDTKKALVSCLNLTYDPFRPVDLSVTPKDDGTSNYIPYFLAALTTKEEVAFLRQNEGGVFVDATKTWLMSNYVGPGQANLANCATVGMGVVLKALHLQLGDVYIERITSLKKEDLASAYSSLTQTANERRYLLLGASLDPLIPDYQIELQSCIDKVALTAPDFFHCQEGAGVVYRVLSNLWPKPESPEQKVPEKQDQA